MRLNGQSASTSDPLDSSWNLRGVPDPNIRPDLLLSIRSNEGWPNEGLGLMRVSLRVGDATSKKAAKTASQRAFILRTSDGSAER